MERLGKYEIENVLGKGAMGLVYKGFDPVIGRPVAIKTILKEMIDPHLSDQLMTRFRNEARAAGRLMHPNIVSIYEYGEDDKNAFIVMEFVEGKELRNYLEVREHIDIEDVCRIMSQLLSALAFAHERNVVHRDIKPGNLILTAGGQLKVADFGIARIDTSTLTMSGTVIGTPAYMSPEQCLGQELDCRSDLFSAGIVLYELMTGQKPFSGALESIAYRICNEDPPLPSRVSKIALSTAIDDVVTRALAREPENRFQTAKEFEEALRRAVGAELVSAEAKDAAPNIRSPKMPVPPQARMVDEATLRTIERELALILGPLAKVMVRRASVKTQYAKDLYEVLAENIPNAEARLRFLEGAKRSSASLAPTASGAVVATAPRSIEPTLSGLDQQFVEAATAKLIHYLGPMAKVATKRTLAVAKNRRELVFGMAAYLPPDRQSLFLRDLGYTDSD